MLKVAGVCVLMTMFSCGTVDAGTNLTYKPRDLETARISLESALRLSKKVIEKKRCEKAIEESIGAPLPKESNVSVNVINTIYWGDLEGESIGLIKWDDMLEHAANTICVRMDDGSITSYINLPLDTILVSSEKFLAYILVHETIHFFQCKADYLFGDNADAAHEEVNRLLDEACYP